MKVSSTEAEARHKAAEGRLSKLRAQVANLRATHVSEVEDLSVQREGRS